jgi:cell division septation protein DedD
MVTVQLHRSGVVFVVIGSLLLGGLLFAGGYLAGMRHGSIAAPKAPAIPKPARTATLPAAVIAPGSPKSAATKPQAKPEQLAIRVGLFVSKEDATAFAQQLTARKLEAAIASSPTSNGATLYSVNVGHYTSRHEAAAAAQTMKRELGIDGAVVTVLPEPLKR